MPLEAYETLQIIREQLRTMEFASLPAIVKTAQNLSKQVDSMTNFELASIISKDPLATAKVLDLANKGGSDKVDVTKLEDAILAAGYGKVRAISMKLLDSERIVQTLRQPEQEEAASINLVSCLIAEQLMNIIGNYDASEAFICTVLRGYGKVLLSTFIIEKYRESLILIPMKGEIGAFRAVFGLTPIELSYELLSETKVPRKIIRTIKALDPAILEAEQVAMSEDLELLIFSEFVYRLTLEIFNFRLNATKFDTALKALMEEFALRFQLPPPMDIAKAENGELQPLFDCMMGVHGMLQQLQEDYEMNPVPDCILDTLTARINHEDPPKQFSGSKKVLSAEARAKRTPEQIIQDGVNNIMATVSRKDVNMQKVHKAIVGTLMDAFKLQDCILFIKDEDSKTPVYIPMEGEGDMFKHVKKRTKLVPGPKDVFGIALEQKCDGLVFDATKPPASKLIPPWVSVDGVNTLFIFNFCDMAEPFIVVAMRRDGTTLQIPGGAMKALAKMRATAMKSRIPDPNEDDYKINFKTFLGALKAAGG